MRLQKKEIQTILQVAKSIYGERVKVYLFGSRLDNTKRGGDIDLLIRTDEAKKGVLARIRMIAQLKYLLGDQKIDIIGDHEDSIVVQEALQKVGSSGKKGPRNEAWARICQGAAHLPAAPSQSVPGSFDPARQRDKGDAIARQR